jgi:hypothetical protein
MASFARRFRLMHVVGGAVSRAEMGPYAGAPRNPELRIDGNKGYSAVRYTTERIAYTTTTATAAQCSRCGEPLVEEHEIDRVRDGGSIALGAVRTCRGCQADSWLVRSHMPAASRARVASRKVIV